MLYNKGVKAAASPTLCSQLEEKKVNPVYDPSKEESWALGMNMLCQGTNTTLDDYYDWNVPKVKMDQVENGLYQLDNQYSDQLHGFARSCLNESEDERPSMEDHLNWFEPYAREAREKRLTFKNARPKQDVLDADNFFDIAEIEEVVKIREERVVENNPTDFDDIFAPRTNTTVQGGNGGGFGGDNFFNTSQNVSQNYGYSQGYNQNNNFVQNNNYAQSTPQYN